jgi:hypothetical protein
MMTAKADPPFDNKGGEMRFAMRPAGSRSSDPHQRPAASF